MINYGYLNGMFVNFKTVNGRASGYVVEVFDEGKGGFAVRLLPKKDERFPNHKTEYVVFAKEVSY